jgi:hypothetical protein
MQSEQHGASGRKSGSCRLAADRATIFEIRTGNMI